MTVTYVQNLPERIAQLSQYFNTLFWSDDVSPAELRKVETEIQQLKSILEK